MTALKQIDRFIAGMHIAQIINGGDTDALVEIVFAPHVFDQIKAELKPGTFELHPMEPNGFRYRNVWISAKKPDPRRHGRRG